MARIRSIHPGLFTDEAFASLSMAARVLLLGIWTEADDHGIFEWKPVTLKMRVMPADNVSIPELLAECESTDLVKRFTDGKSYGLVRNFCRFQRPKKPKYVHPMPTELRTYAGLNKDGSIVVLHQSRTDGEKSSQREDGGGEGEEESGIEIEKGEGGKPAPAKVLKEISKEGTRLSLGFEPSSETVAAIIASGFIDEQYRSELSKFMAYYMTRGTQRVDWDAGLILWFQRATPDPANKPAPPSLSNKIHVKTDTPQWRAWCDHLGKTPPVDRKFGWLFDSEWPPGYQERISA